MANTALLSQKMGVEPLDLYEVIGDRKTALILDRANMLHCATQGDILEVPSSIRFPKGNTLFLMTFIGGLAALLATGATHGHRVIARAHAFHSDTDLCVPLYERVDTIIVQSPLASEVAISQGIDPKKLFYLPYQLPEKLPPKRTGPEFVVGCATRFEYRRNIEFLIWAFAKAAPDIPNAKLVLRGGLDPCADVLQGEGYTERLKMVLAWAQQQPWFHWDQRRTASHQEALSAMARFDLHVHMGGSEDPANAVIECLGIGVPQLLLRCGGPHHLFEDLVAWTPHTGFSNMRQGAISFFIPDTDALAANIIDLVHDEKRRTKLAQHGMQAAQERFAFDPARLATCLKNG